MTDVLTQTALWHIWWAWIAFGIVLGILEIIVPGFIFLGFAIGAVAVGLIVAQWGALSLPWALLIFAVASVGAWLLLRQIFGVRAGQKKVWDRDINED